ncbi:MAG: ABC transporter ATP-binding protein [Candidatus Acetothermia bacterium]
MNDSETPLLKVDTIKGFYREDFGQEVKAVNGVSFELNRGEKLGIAGESGCGKSTLAKCISGLFNPPLEYVDGRVFLDGEDIMELEAEKLKKQIRGRRISYIPQSAMNALNPTAKVKNLVWDIVKQHNPKTKRRQAVAKARERSDMLNLPERVLEEYSCEFSGGMKQRIIIMLSTLLDPDVLIADEPTSALDVSTQKALVKMLKGLVVEEVAGSLIFITHDLTTLRHVTERIAVMYAGEFVELGTVEQIIFDPVHPYTKALISSILVPEPGIREKELEIISGKPPDLHHPPEGCRFYPRCDNPDRQAEGCNQEHPEMVSYKSRLVRCHAAAEKVTAKSGEEGGRNGK